ncbi:MAG: 16S rRNA (cytosine(1402)-N(4))-methyltransferase RsmH [Clostridia bacterium]
MQFEHVPIMAKEILDYLSPKEGDVFLDGTIGGAGHSILFAEKIGKNGKLIGIDKDETALEVSGERLAKFENAVLVRDDFKNIKQILADLKIKKLNGALLDLGVSSYQLDTAERGFSFRNDGPLDMRMDKRQEFSAWEVVNTFTKEKIAKIIKEYGEEDFANLIASSIVKQREISPINSTIELKNVIENCLPKKIVYKSGGCSKKTFQAIRIFVNGELESLSEAIQVIIDSLEKGGRFAILTFHSLEDRIVKNVFKDNSTGCICPPKTPICICGHKAKIKLVNRKPDTAGEFEVLQNSRSTCAKLRVVEKI